MSAELAYRFGDEVPMPGVDAGRSVLVTVSHDLDGFEFVLRLATSGIDDDVGVTMVSTDERGTSVRDRLENGADLVDRLAVVDCVGSGDGSDLLCGVSSPQDLTGIGIRFSQVQQRLRGRGNERQRIGLHNVSTLLMYHDLRTVFRFLHSFTGRVDATGTAAFMGMNRDSHPDETFRTVSQLCDARVDVRLHAGEEQVRVRGRIDGPSEWTTLR